MSIDVPQGSSGWTYEDLIELLSAERLGSYLTSKPNSLVEAFALYEWNMRAASAVMHSTGMVEVIVRNALVRELVAWADRRGDSSWLDTAPLDARGLADIKKARERATSFGKTPEMHGKVIAELSLGFWRFLVARRYLTSLWIPALHSAFPYSTTHDLGQRQRSVERLLTNLAFVRNRAAHHEPIHRRDLGRDHRSCIDLSNWVDPTAGAWVSARTQLDLVANLKP